MEAIHGVFRGGTTSLPITSPNLTFQEFLSKMNKAEQIVRAEHNLKMIAGNSIVASKKKRTFAKTSREQPHTDAAEYSKPQSYSEFSVQFTQACNCGDEASKEMIEKLIPQMASALKNANDDDLPECMKIISSLSEISPIKLTLIDTIIDKELSDHIYDCKYKYR